MRTDPGNETHSVWSVLRSLCEFNDSSSLCHVEQTFQTPYSVTAPLFLTVVCVSLMAVWKEKTLWLHWLESMEGLREMLY